LDEELATAVAGRPVYVHIDCDVLDAGTVPTDYLVPGGMTLDQLLACAEVIARSEIVGIELGELETADDAEPTSGPYQPAKHFVDALDPIFSALLPPGSKPAHPMLPESSGQG
jgi:hypothetical protein